MLIRISLSSFFLAGYQTRSSSTSICFLSSFSLSLCWFWLPYKSYWWIMFILEKHKLLGSIFCLINIMVVVCWSVCLSEVTKVNDPLNGLLNVYVSYLLSISLHRKSQSKFPHFLTIFWNLTPLMYLWMHWFLWILLSWFCDQAAPVCLPSSNSNYEGKENCVVTGWGKDQNGKMPKKMKQVIRWTPS